MTGVALLWSAAKQQALQEQLVGFWAADQWDLVDFPVPLRRVRKKSRYLRFTCRSAPLNLELKYACWQKFISRQWNTLWVSPFIHTLIRWLNDLDPPDASFLARNLEEWESSFRAWLSEHGIYTKDRTTRVDAAQQLRCSAKEPAFFHALRQIYAVLQDVYDDRPEEEKEIWDIRKLGCQSSPSLCDHTLNFSRLRQSWLREAARRFIRYYLSFYSVGHSLQILRSLTAFSTFLHSFYPNATAQTVDRQTLLHYLSYLTTIGISRGSQKNRAMHLRTFIETSAREGWADFSRERLLFDDELPQLAKLQPRYIPEDVLAQLNGCLDSLPASFRRMALILQTCGLRIGELLALPYDCLLQDARGGWYLRYYQTKLKQEHTIPLAAETAAIIQEQQREVAARYPAGHRLLFPNKDGQVYKQYSFAHALNRLAREQDIRDSTGRLFRFQSHQFRHTVGTRMINFGVPQHIIQRYLGHKSPEMTSRYAHIHDQTMKEKLAAFLNARVVDVNGRVAEQRSLVDSADLQWFSRNILAQALPNGYCAIPAAAGPCPHPNACLTCPHFRTDVSFIQIHRAELAETERVLATAQAHGWLRQMEMNERKKSNLQAIIAGLEKHDEA
jgi:integrase